MSTCLQQTIEVPATEERVHQVQVPRAVTTVQTVQQPVSTFQTVQQPTQYIQGTGFANGVYATGIYGTNIGVPATGTGYVTNAGATQGIFAPK